MRAPLGIASFMAAVVFLLGACGGGEDLSTSLSPSPRDGQASPANGLPMDLSPEPSPSPRDGPTSPADGLPMEFETIDIGQYSGIVGQQPQVFKIDTEVEWEEFWSRHQAIVSPAAPLPAVDFSREMVVAAVDRQESSGGYRLEITGIEESEGGLLVRVSKEVPGLRCVVSAAVTQPFHIARTPKSDLEPQLLLGEETVSCG